MRTDKRGRRKRRFGIPALGFALAASLGVVIGAGIALQANPIATAAERIAQALRRPGFSLTKVDFVGLRALEGDALWKLTGLEFGVPLVDVDVERIEHELVEHPRIARVSAVRLPPGRLIIGVRERVPVALDAKSLLGIDDQGERFPILPVEVAGLTRVRGSASRALPLIEAASKFGAELESIDARADNDVRFRVRDDGTLVRIALIQTGREPRASLVNWQEIRESGLIDGYGAKEIDLRFPGSVVLRGLERTEKGGTKDGS